MRRGRWTLLVVLGVMILYTATLVLTWSTQNHRAKEEKMAKTLDALREKNRLTSDMLSRRFYGDGEDYDPDEGGKGKKKQRRRKHDKKHAIAEAAGEAEARLSHALGTIAKKSDSSQPLEVAIESHMNSGSRDTSTLNGAKCVFIPDTTYKKSPADTKVVGIRTKEECCEQCMARLECAGAVHGQPGTFQWSAGKWTLVPEGICTMKKSLGHLHPRPGSMACQVQKPPCNKRAIVVTHKTGTLMARAVYDKVHEHLWTDDRCQSKFPFEVIDSAPHSIFLVHGQTEQGRKHWMRKDVRKKVLDEYRLIPPDTNFVQSVRNPFDKIVSGYLYHRKAAEPWCDIPLGQGSDGSMLLDPKDFYLPLGQRALHRRRHKLDRLPRRKQNGFGAVGTMHTWTKGMWGLPFIDAVSRAVWPSRAVGAKHVADYLARRTKWKNVVNEHIEFAIQHAAARQDRSKTHEIDLAALRKKIAAFWVDDTLLKQDRLSNRTAQLPKESYAAYLARAPYADGLMAEVLRSHALETLPMAALFVIIKATGLHGAAAVCLEDFKESSSNVAKCTATWQRVADTFGYPAAPASHAHNEFSGNVSVRLDTGDWRTGEHRENRVPVTAKLFVEVAGAGCGKPGKISTSHATERGEVRNTLLSELRRLDKETLGGVLARIEAELGCNDPS